MIFQLGSIILQAVFVTRPMRSMHVLYGRLTQCLRCCNLALLILYTPDLINRTIMSGFIGFVKQSAACVDVSIQATSPLRRLARFVVAYLEPARAHRSSDGRLSSYNLWG